MNDTRLTGKFDWYAATVRDSPFEVERALAVGLDAEVVDARPMHGYKQACEFRRADGSTAARMLWDGNGDWPHAWASGDDTPAFVEIVRGLWPAHHHVTRMDSAVDFRDGSAWDALYAACVAIADERRLKLGTAGDWVRAESDDGRTLYVGSMKSPVFVRLYEKGKQLRATVAEGADQIPADWVRLEVQVRPQRESRRAAATSSPAEAWGYSSWTRDLAAEVLASDVPRVQVHVWREADDERALAFMLRQYGKILKRRADGLGGDWAALGVELGTRLGAEPDAERTPF